MDTSLVVAQQRHLSIPDAALFSPTELCIAVGTSETDFIRIVKAVAALDNAGDMWVADASLHAIKTWGNERGLEITSAATGYKKGCLLNSSNVAAAFPPEKRFTCYTFTHYRRLLAFPADFRDAFLARHLNENLSSRDLYALAVKEFGSAPYKAKQPKKCTVSIRAELYARLHPYSGPRMHVLIESILEEWLRIQPPPPKPESEPAKNLTLALELQAKLEEKEAEKRATYAERRQAMIDAGEKRIPAKEGRKKNKPSIQLAWSECKADAYLDSELGVTQMRRTGGSNPTRFFSEADAIAAEQNHFEEKGYREQVKKCDVCSGGNARKPAFHIYHVYAGANQ